MDGTIKERVFASNDRKKTPNDKPVTVNQAIDFLMTQMAFRYQVAIANSSEDELNSYFPIVGLYIGNRLMNTRNDNLLESCRQVAKDKYLHWCMSSKGFGQMGHKNRRGFQIPKYLLPVY